MKLYTSLSVLALSATVAHAQCFTDALGTAQGAGDDTASTVSLGFNFTMPDGTVVSDIDILSNGRVVAVGADAADFTQTVAEFIATPMICAFWSDVNFADAASDDLYFQTDGVGRAVIQFNQVVEFNGTDPFSYTLILNGDDSWEVQYGNSAPVTDDAIIGYSDGSNVDPGETDLSMAIGGGLTLGAIAYEELTAETNDLAGTTGSSLLFISSGAGAGYTVVGSDCMLTPPLPQATLTDLGQSCNFAPPLSGPFSVTWIPDGTGGYVVVPNTGIAFDSNIGTDVGATDDSVSPAALGFNFTMPGGAVVTDFEIDSNGRVFETGADASDFSPTVQEGLDATGGSINPLWVDMDADATEGGVVSFFTDGVSSANVTWNAIQFAGDIGSNLLFQLQLNGTDGSWTVVYENIGAYASDTSTFDNNIIVGCFAGNGAVDPGETDVTAGVTTNGDPNQYEFFDSTIPEDQDFQTGGGVDEMILTSNEPEITGDWNLAVDGLPTTALLGVYGIGFVNLMAPLALIDAGNPCSLLTSIDLVSLPITSIGMTMDTAPAIPLTGAPVGLPLFAQVLVVDPTALPTAIPVITSNGLQAVTGI